MNKPLLLNRDFITQTTLVVDDISDTGKTLRRIALDSKIKFPTATLWVDKKTKFEPTFFCRAKKQNEWIIFPFETLKTSKRDN